MPDKSLTAKKPRCCRFAKALSLIKKSQDEIFPVEVYAGSIWEVEMVKSLLENAEIETFLHDENTGTLAPWYTAGGGAGSVKVVVSNLDFEKARLIIAEYENNEKK